MNDLKKGDLVKVKATNQVAEVFFASTMGEKFYILVEPNTTNVLEDDNVLKFFFSPGELDYTDEQKEHFWHEAQEHAHQMQSIHHL